MDYNLPFPFFNLWSSKYTNQVLLILKTGSCRRFDQFTVPTRELCWKITLRGMYFGLISLTFCHKNKNILYSEIEVLANTLMHCEIAELSHQRKFLSRNWAKVRL